MEPLFLGEIVMPRKPVKINLEGLLEDDVKLAFLEGLELAQNSKEPERRFEMFCSRVEKNVLRKMYRAGLFELLDGRGQLLDSCFGWFESGIGCTCAMTEVGIPES